MTIRFYANDKLTLGWKGPVTRQALENYGFEWIDVEMPVKMFRQLFPASFRLDNDFVYWTSSGLSKVIQYTIDRIKKNYDL